MNCTVTQNRIHAYMDGELDLVKALDVEAHLNQCAACRQAHDQHAVSRAIIRRHATYFGAPAILRSRICASIEPVRQQARLSRFRLPSWDWPAFGAALAFSIVLTWSITSYLIVPAAGDRLPEQVVASHVRALVSGRLADVVSSDQGSVKPWLSGRLDFSPPVNDLAADGYALIGARIDYIRDRRVAALVYSHGGHPINVFVWPATADDAPTRILSRKGYNLVNWIHAGMFFCAVSDLSHAELAELARMLQTGNG